MRVTYIILALATALAGNALAQSADWQRAVWRDPQVRYLLADMTLGGNVGLYRDYAAREQDPDSREAIRLWDAGSRVVNTNDFERRWVTNRHGLNGRVMRIVLRGTLRTITGQEVLLTTDRPHADAVNREVVLDLTLGAAPGDYEERRGTDPDIAEALRRWAAGARAINAHLFRRTAPGTGARFGRAADGQPASASRAVLNTDLPYPETNVRYFMADIALGGSLEFYRAAAERDHEMGCLEAVRRTEEGYRITNLELFERKQLDGRTVITRKGGRTRIQGTEVSLSSD